MTGTDQPRFRPARPADAAAVAALHVDSCRRNYRGAYTDSFLDGDVGADRLTVWTDRFGAAAGRDHTQLAEFDGEVVGLVHTILSEDPTWGFLRRR